MTNGIRGLLGEGDEYSKRLALLILVPSVLVVGVAIAIATSTSDARTARVFDNVHWTVAYAASAALAWLGSRDAPARDRRPKRWFAWGLTAYAVAQVLWNVQVVTGWHPFPGPADLFFIAMGPLTGLGCVALLARSQGRAERLTASLDVAGLTVAVLALTLAIYLPRRGDVGLVALCFMVATPVVLCWAACTATVTVLMLRIPLTRGLVLFIPGLLGNAVLQLKWNQLSLDHALADGMLVSGLFSLCTLAQGTGALLLRTEPAPGKAWERVCEVTLRLLPLLLVIVSAIAVVLAYTVPQVRAPVRWSALIGGLVVVVIATARQSLLLSERERRIQTELELRKAEETFRVLVEQAADGIFIIDANGVYRDVNTRGAEMLGMTREEVIGKRISDVVLPEQASRIGPELEQLQLGDRVHSSWVLRRKDGSQFHAEVTAKQLPDGRFQGFVRDVSERLALEAQLRQSQKMEAVGVLASGIAHDFNNVLMAIQGNAALAAQDIGVNHPARSSIADIQRAVERAAELVQRILAFSRPRLPATESVSLTPLIEEVVKLLRPTLPAGIELKCSFPAVSPTVSADPGQLHQVLMNLCANAWQAMHGNPGTIEISVAACKLHGDEPGLELAAGEYARISVSDSGHGMSSATQERIFEPFFTTKAPGEGTGLGLSVVHSIVRGHRGAIHVESTPGGGSTFRIYLPAQQVAPADEQPACREPRPRLDAAGIRVAYVDDEKQIVTVMVRQLERLGYQIRGFHSARAFLTTLREEGCVFDVVVTDFNMPAISGLELIRCARELCPGATFVLTSGYVSDTLRKDAEQTGVSRLIKKPETIERFCAAINEAAQEGLERAPRSSSDGVNATY